MTTYPIASAALKRLTATRVGFNLPTSAHSVGIRLDGVGDDIVTFGTFFGRGVVALGNGAGSNSYLYDTASGPEFLIRLQSDSVGVKVSGASAASVVLGSIFGLGSIALGDGSGVFANLYYDGGPITSTTAFGVHLAGDTASVVALGSILGTGSLGLGDGDGNYATFYYENGGLTFANQIKASPNRPSVIKTGSYTFVFADFASGSTFEYNSTSAGNFTIPPNASVAAPVGSVLEVAAINTGDLTVVAGAGVTIVNPYINLTITQQYGTMRLRQRAANVWIVENTSDITVTTSIYALIASPTFTGTVASTGGAVNLTDGTATDGAVQLSVANIGVPLSAVNVKNNSADSQPSATIYQANGVPAVALGPGGSTAPDVKLERTGSAAATLTGQLTVATGLTVADTKNVVLATGTGTKIGTATSQKLGLWNATPVIQPAATGTTSGFTAGAGTAVDSAATFTGGVGSKAYTIGDVVLALKQAGIMAAS